MNKKIVLIGIIIVLIIIITVLIIGSSKKQNENNQSIVNTGVVAKEISQNPTEYYGKIVNNYNANDIEYKIFYANDNNIFLIASDYVENSKLPTTIGLTTQNTYQVFWNDIDSIINSSIDSEISNKYMMNFNENENNNYKAVSCILDTSKWNEFVDSNYAESAIGSPTLEMYIESWNGKNYEHLYYANNEDGFYFGTTENPSTGFEDMSASTGYNDTLYYPYTSEYENCHGYWIASPAFYNEDRLVYINYDGHIAHSPYNGYTLGFRPVICLQSDVAIEKDGEGYKLTK